MRDGAPETREAGHQPRAAGQEPELVPLPTIYDTVMAVQEGRAQRALVPIENSLEGSVDITLDTLAHEATDVRITGEVVHPITQCLIAARDLRIQDVRAVVSHPQATAQCRRFLRERLPNAQVHAAESTAEAVRSLAERGPGWAAIANRVAAERYGGVIVAEAVEDVSGNVTRFAWLEREEQATGAAVDATGPGARAKTAVVFWGPGTEAPGWLVRCLSEFAVREVNLTRIESRPRRQGLGRYMFFVDLEGAEGDPPVADALRAVREHVEVLRVLGSFPAASPAG